MCCVLRHGLQSCGSRCAVVCGGKTCQRTNMNLGKNLTTKKTTHTVNSARRAGMSQRTKKCDANSVCVHVFTLIIFSHISRNVFLDLCSVFVERTK